MKLGLSKKRPGQRRHIVLVCEDRKTASEVHMIIYNQVLEQSSYPERDFRPDGRVLYRFSMKWLEPLMLTFPHAEFSDPLEAYMSAKLARELDRMPVPDLANPDGFRGELRDYQKIGSDRLIKRNLFLLNDDLGLGKTIMLLFAIIYNRTFPALVVSPNSIKYNWLQEIEKFTDCTVNVLDGSAAAKRSLLQTDADITVANHEALQVKSMQADDVCDCDELGGGALHTHYWYQFKNPGLFFQDDTVSELRDVDIAVEPRRDWAAIAVDEYHEFKNPEAQRTAGLHLLEAPIKQGLSGSPMLNGRPEELWSILHWQYPRRFPDFKSFEANHTIRKGSRIIAYKNLPELKQFFHNRSLRRRKEQVLDQLPEVITVDRFVDMPAEQRRIYEEIRDEMRIWVNERPRSVTTFWAKTTRLRQACFSPELYGGSLHSVKIDEARADMAQLVAAGHKAIMYSEWSTATRILQREFAEYNPAYVDGNVKARDRMDQVNRFNEDEDCKLFIGTLGSCRQGFSLSAGSYVLFLNKYWVPEVNRQAAGRSAAGGLRGEGHSSVHIIEYKARDTIEIGMDAMLARKKRVNDRMVESDGGRKIERVTIEDLKELLG